MPANSRWDLIQAFKGQDMLDATCVSDRYGYRINTSVTKQFNVFVGRRWNTRKSQVALHPSVCCPRDK